MKHDRSVALALGGLVAMAAALGIGRFVYTPILPAMIEGLGWSKADAGLVAAANFLGYLLGALAAGHRVVSAQPRQWLLGALLVSAATTAAMALPSATPAFAVLRFVSGVASAIVIVCASTLVLARLAASGRSSLSALHFAGVGAGIMISAAAVSGLLAAGVGWRGQWVGTGAIAAIGVAVAGLLIPDQPAAAAGPPAGEAGGGTVAPGATAMVAAYGLFGFGYVITATFLVAIVRMTAEVRGLEPWIWLLVGAAAVPSVALWRRLGDRIGLMQAFAIAALVEAAGVAASVEWVTIAGACVSAVLLGGTFMGITALGLLIARQLSGGAAHRAIGRMTASFGFGQMLGPIVAGYLFEHSGSFRVASLAAAAALLVAAGLAMWSARAAAR